jgi:exopolysaccharide production protein ExoZ
MLFSAAVRRAFEVQHGGTSTIPAMEGLRGVAVFWVFLVHYYSLMEPWLSTTSTTFVVATYMHNVGNAGVDLFFVLSGYLIYRMLLTRPTPFRQYIGRRARRIYPAFLLVLSVYIVLAQFFPDKRALPSGWLPLTGYVAANALLLPGLFPITPIISVAWSLSYEVFYYLMVPATIGLLALRRRTSIARIGLALLVSAIGFVYCYTYGTHIRLLMFIAGILVYEFGELGLTPTWRGFGLVCFATGVAGMVLVKAGHFNGWWRFVVLYASFLGLCLDAFRSSGITARVFSGLSLRAFGNMSYSYYLIHGLTLQFVVLVLGKVWAPAGTTTWEFWAMMPVMFAMTLVTSIGLFVFVEKPFSLAHRAPAAAERARRLPSPGQAMSTEPV